MGMLVTNTNLASTLEATNERSPAMQRELQRKHTVPGCTGTATEWHAWERLRLRYQDEDHDLWTQTELAHLQFLRWLTQNGRLFEDGGPAVSDDAGATDR